MNRSEVTILNVTPDVNEPVKLECEWTAAGQDKSWYSDGIEVSPASGQLNITEESGILTLSISTFNENYTGSYTCIITAATNYSYTVVLRKKINIHTIWLIHLIELYLFSIYVYSVI